MKQIIKVVISVAILLVLTIGFYYVTKTISNVTGKSIIGWIIKQEPKNSEELNSFVKCLSSKGVILFVNENCPYCRKQKDYFGNSLQYLEVIACETYGESCSENNIEHVPTWKINGVNYAGVKSIEELSMLSGCVLNSE